MVDRIGEDSLMHKTGSRVMLSFTIVWIGQVFSLLGTSMTSFALAIWAWQISGRATTLALISFFSFAPTVLVSPFAGVLVDRWNRKLTMMLSDLAAGLSTVATLSLFALGRLQIWHLFVTGAFTGAFQAFQFPAYSAAVTMMIPKQQYARASGMLSMAQFASGVFAPIVAALLIDVIGIGGIMTVDLISLLVAILFLLLVRIPELDATKRQGQMNILKESAYGFQYIYKRSSLLGLQLVLFFCNLFSGVTYTLLNPMILSRTDNDKIVLGSVQSAGAIGGVAGGLLLSVWGGPKRKVHGILIGMLLSSLLGQLLLGLGRTMHVWALASFLSVFFIPIINGSNQAIWQSKVPPDVQGRVFATRRLIAQMTTPAAMLLSGALADNFFEPAMRLRGGLDVTLGWLVGTGPGAGIALMNVVAGVLGVVVSVGSYAFHMIRKAEDILPDHEKAVHADILPS